MPLLQPHQIHEVLKATRSLESSPSGDMKEGMRELLEKNNLSPDEILDNLSGIMRSGESDSVRLQAAKLGAQLNGMLMNNEGVVVPSVTIIINNGDNMDVNPILIPR